MVTRRATRRYLGADHVARHLSQAISGFKPASRGRLRNRLASAGVQLAVATASMLTGGSQPYYGKRLPLDSTYSLVLIERPRRRSGNRRSFALAAGRADIETLAVFHSGDDGVGASSRADEPCLVIETAPNTKQAYEIVHTTFSAETVLPIEPVEAALGAGHAEQLELRILPGTSISWPLGSVIRLRPQLRPELDLD